MIIIRRDKALSRLAGQTILVTGASGYIGSALTLRLANLGCSVVRWSRRPMPFPEPAGRIADVQGDITDPASWRALLVPGGESVFGVVHLAAQTSVYVSWRDPAADYAVNALPVLAMLTACRELGIRPVTVLAGTSTACGIARELPVGPLTADNPVTIYDAHKLLAEQYLKCFCRESDIPGTSLRLTNIYGPGPRSGSPDRGVLNKMIVRGIKGEPLTVYGTGEQIRDYLYIDDAVEAFVLALAEPESVSGRHFVVGSGEGCSIRDVFKLVAQRLAVSAGIRTEVVEITPPDGLSVIESRNFIADISLFSAATDWIPETPLSAGIDKTIAFFQQQESEAS